MKTLSDHELLLKVAGKEPEALFELYERYSSIIFTLLNKILENSGLSTKVLEEVFDIVWNKASMYDGNSENPFVWLISISRNKAVDYLRRERDPENTDPYSDDYENYFILPRISNQIDPLNLEIALSLNKNIEDSLVTLTNAQQYVIYLAFYEGLSQSEISKRLNIPISTVKSKVKQALVALKENLVQGG